MNFKMDAKALFDNAKVAIKKHSPEILMVVGVISFGATLFSVRKAAKKEDEVLAPVKEEIKELKEQEESKENTLALAKAYTKCVGRVARLYSWSTMFAGISVGSFFGAKKVLDVRYDNLSAAYILLDKSYKGILERVKTKYGEEAVTELKNGFEKVEAADGTVQHKRNVDGVLNPYSFYFDRSSTLWKNDAGYNLTQALHIEQELNRRIRRMARLSPSGRAHLFFDEVYKMFGVQFQSGYELKNARISGWTYDRNIAKTLGENYMSISLGLRDDVNKRVWEGAEPVIFISANVDGVILDRIEAGDTNIDN